MNPIKTTIIILGILGGICWVFGVLDQSAALAISGAVVLGAMMIGLALREK